MKPITALGASGLKPIAVLGASGFVGVRLMEMHHLGGGAPLRPIYYRPASVALLSRFHLDWRIADYTNVDALAKAMEGCETVIHLAVADPQTIRQLTTPVYEAAVRSGVRRMVFMSSASVHGQTPARGTTEATPLPVRQAFEYNAAKAEAEQLLLAARAKGDVELVILRPSIVWGPRSRWVVDPVLAVQSGTFGWLNGGHGIMNPIYVDNLVHAMDCACTAPVDGQTFLLNDHAPLTWREFFTPWIEAAGGTVESTPDAEAYVASHSLSSRIERIRNQAMVRRLAPKMPGLLKRSIKALVGALPEQKPADPFANLNYVPGGPVRLTQEMTLLESCAWRFPVEPARAKLGWEPVVDWPTAVQRTLGWLEFANLLPEKKEFPKNDLPTLLGR